MKDQSEHIAESTNLENKEENIGGSFLDCFNFASIADWFIASGGILLALLNGVSKAVLTLVLSLALSSFDIRYTAEELQDKANQIALYFVIVAVSIFIGLLGSRTLLRINAQRQGFNFRRAYLKALFEHEISFFEKINPMEFSSQIENDCRAIVDALDLQLEAVFSCVGTLVSALIISFLRSWEIALMMFVAAPFTLIAMNMYDRSIMKAFAERSVAYSKAGAIAEEALTNIKTVVSLGGEKAELQRYNEAVDHTQKLLSRNGLFQGITFGLIELIFMVSMAAIFYIGSFFIEEGRYNSITGDAFSVADIFTPLNAILAAFSQIPVVVASLNGLYNAKIKARKILDVIDKVKKSESANQTVENFKGAISFKNVSFAYPANPDKLVLTDFSVDIQPNTKVAFVGESGSGKSTIIQLLQKFYEPKSGSIEVDGHDIRNLDISWLRRNISYVGQEPVLFSLTIRDNLLLAKEDATEDELIEALKKANAYEFVMEMEKKLDTLIGGGASTHLSGGQKQRIAIARALLKDARVLILDEATSALDRISEKEIQETLDNLSGDRTIIIVAHRLSTIKEADQIIVLDEGKVKETGKHEELLLKGGKYSSIQATQIGVSPIKSKYDKNRNITEEDEEEDEQEGAEGEGFDEPNLPLLSNKSSKSKSKREEKMSEQQTGSQRLTISDIKRLWALMKDERKNYLWGFLGCLGFSIVLPFNNYITALFLGVMVRYNDPDYRANVNLLCILFVIGGILIFIAASVEFGLFAKASESLIQTLRSKVFYKFLRMHVGWHDRPKNKPGNLVTSLEVDTGNVGQITGISLGIIIQILLANFVTIVAALVVSWQLALIGIILVPLVLLTALKLNSNEAKGEEKGAVLISKTDVLVSEAINNMKTIISLDAHKKFLKEYCLIISQYQEVKLRVKILNGFIEGALYLILYCDLAAMYYLGTYLFFTQGLEPHKIFFTVFGVALSAIGSTQLFVLMPDTGKAIHSTHQLFHYLEMRSLIDIEDKTKVFRGKIKGKIEFKNVKFSYPTRSAQIFNNLSFKIDAGRHIGLTGPSGCGKSTIIQLLLRLYDVNEGEILIDDVNIQDYDLTYLRRKIAVVSQEPVLFYGSIEYNLKYANDQVSDAEMKEAAKKAYATRFIGANAEVVKDEKKSENPPAFSSNSADEGYQRLVGSKGGQLSGGQKQRIAIARAILRKPKILLLDEATSALDNESESLVQNALKTLSEGLTAISIAHRLSTLQETEEIAVLKDGMIAERGNYEELLKKQGYFYQLNEVSFH